MHRRHLLAIAAALGPIASLMGRAAPPPDEQARIDKLIRHVELQKGMVFIRNGSEYSSEQAAKFLRGKMESMGAEVTTAREFIERIATRSSMSGKPYQIRLADGTVLPAAHYLTDQLKRIESQPA
jgi:hypothetical protein